MGASHTGRCGIAPDPGTYWNGVEIGSFGDRSSINYEGSISSPALTNSDGLTPSSVTFTLDHFGAYDTQAYSGVPNPAGYAPALLSDYAYAALAPGTNGLLTISGLDPQHRYDLYLYSQNGGYASQPSDFVIGGVAHSATNTSAANGGFVLNNNYVVFAGLTGSSQLAVEMVNFSASLNGFQLLDLGQQVPEPSTILLLGLGGLVVFRLRQGFGGQGRRAQRV
jgi:hypothetical protein